MGGTQPKARVGYVVVQQVPGLSLSFESQVALFSTPTANLLLGG